MRLLDELGQLERLLEGDTIERDARRIGVEQEMFLVDAAGRPSPHGPELVAGLDERFTTELARYNLEANLPPVPLDRDFLTVLHDQLDAAVVAVQQAAAEVGAAPILTGILPTIGEAHLTPESMTPDPRYRALTAAVMSQRGGQPLQVFIRGEQQFEARFRHVMPESANCSLQLHLQVAPEEFALRYNLAQLISAPVLAAATGSPIFCGRRLWHETRVALFERAVDPRTDAERIRGAQPRVLFGRDWLEGSILELFRDNLVRHRLLLTSTAPEEDPDSWPPRLAALQLHNGTIWRWNRPCYGLFEGTPHLRIENRVLPSGPTVPDAVANAALYYGLLEALARRRCDPRTRLAFRTVRNNFVAVARGGLYAPVTWLDGRTSAARDLLRRELLPLAEEGLRDLSVPSEVRQLYMGILTERIESGLTPSRWMRRALETLPQEGVESNRALVLKLGEALEAGCPLHRLAPALRTRRSAILGEGAQAEAGLCVEDVMTTDLATVGPDDSVALAAKIMEWRNLRHLPVESAEGQVLGLLTDLAAIRLPRAPGGALAPVRELMDAKPALIDPRASLLEAALAMHRSGRTCVLATAAGHGVGILTAQDLLRVVVRLRTLRRRLAQTPDSGGLPVSGESSSKEEEAVQATMSVRDLMTDRVFSLGPDDPLSTVQELMWDHDIRHVPIVDDEGELIGLVSLRDLSKVIDRFEGHLPLSERQNLLEKTRVRDIMTTDVATADEDDDIRTAAAVMLENKYGCLPVVAGGRLVGILTESDFVRVLAEGR